MCFVGFCLQCLPNGTALPATLACTKLACTTAEPSLPTATAAPSSAPSTPSSRFTWIERISGGPARRAVARMRARVAPVFATSWRAEPKWVPRMAAGLTQVTARRHAAADSASASSCALMRAYIPPSAARALAPTGVRAPAAAGTTSPSPSACACMDGRQICASGRLPGACGCAERRSLVRLLHDRPTHAHRRLQYVKPARASHHSSLPSARVCVWALHGRFSTDWIQKHRTGSAREDTFTAQVRLPSHGVPRERGAVGGMLRLVRRWCAIAQRDVPPRKVGLSMPSTPARSLTRRAISRRAGCASLASWAQGRRAGGGRALRHDAAGRATAGV